MTKEEFEAKIKEWVDSMPHGPDGVTAVCEWTGEPFKLISLGILTKQKEPDYSLLYALLFPKWVSEFGRVFEGKRGPVYWRKRPEVIIDDHKSMIYARASKGK